MEVTGTYLYTLMGWSPVLVLMGGYSCLRGRTTVPDTKWLIFHINMLPKVFGKTENKRKCGQ